MCKNALDFKIESAILVNGAVWWQGTTKVPQRPQLGRVLGTRARQGNVFEAGLLLINRFG